MLLIGQTTSVRFFLAVFSLFLALDISLDMKPDESIEFIFHTITGSLGGRELWIGLLLLHAFMLLKGLTGRYGPFHLIFESVLGWALWALLAVSQIIVDGHPGIAFAGFLMATWLLIRYPTHWRASRGRSNNH
jgi:hypothetical protein